MATIGARLPFGGRAGIPQVSSSLSKVKKKVLIVLVVLVRVRLNSYQAAMADTI
jgi:hypothetical protein